MNKIKFKWRLGSSPSGITGVHCMKPSKCPFYNQCWDVEPNETFLTEKYLNRKQKKKLVSKGVFTLSNIPNDAELTREQWENIHAFPKCDSNKLKKFTNSWSTSSQYHFVHFDYIKPAIPIYENTSPYQKIYFQISVLSKLSNGDEIVHRKFLNPPGIDPRINIIETLLKYTAGEGKIFIYDIKERSPILGEEDVYPTIEMLKSLQNEYPVYFSEIADALNRIINLAEPFEKRWYYNPLQKGDISWDTISKTFLGDLDPTLFPYGSEEIAKSNYKRFSQLTSRDQILTIRTLPSYGLMNAYALVNIADTFFIESGLRKAA
ncbi:MAG: DUF2779 domain-containing protein [Bacteroidota bacterium]